MEDLPDPEVYPYSEYVIAVPRTEQLWALSGEVVPVRYPDNVITYRKEITRGGRIVWVQVP